MPETLRTEVFAPLLEDLAVPPGHVWIGTPPPDLPPRPHRVVVFPAGETPDAPASAQRLARELAGVAEDGWRLVYLEGTRDERELARWRDLLWPASHVGRIYSMSKHEITRRTLAGRERLPRGIALRGELLAARSRAHVLSPQQTVEKFDNNAGGWSGTPGSVGWRHHRWMRRFVAELAQGSRPARILDFGCGAGWVGIEAALAAPGAELCAFDPSPAMVRLAEENARAAGVTRFVGRTGFGEEPPFPAAGEARFELVLASGVISFSPDPERWLDGLVGTLAPGATLVVGDLNPLSHGMRTRRRTHALLPIRELNARTAAEVRAGLERRGCVHERTRGYQLSSPAPELLHLCERSGAFGHVGAALLLGANRAGSATQATLGLPPQSAFDSWVMRLRAPR